MDINSERGVFHGFAAYITEIFSTVTACQETEAGNKGKETAKAAKPPRIRRATPPPSYTSASGTTAHSRGVALTAASSHGGLEEHPRRAVLVIVLTAVLLQAQRRWRVGAALGGSVSTVNVTKLRTYDPSCIGHGFESSRLDGYTDL